MPTTGPQDSKESGKQAVSATSSSSSQRPQTCYVGFDRLDTSIVLAISSAAPEYIKSRMSLRDSSHREG